MCSYITLWNITAGVASISCATHIKFYNILIISTALKLQLPINLQETYCLQSPVAEFVPLHDLSKVVVLLVAWCVFQSQKLKIDGSDVCLLMAKSSIEKLQRSETSLTLFTKSMVICDSLINIHSLVSDFTLINVWLLETIVCLQIKSKLI